MSKVCINFDIKHEFVEEPGIKHEFLVFNPENVVLDTVLSARLFSKQMGKCVFEYLNKLIKNEENTEKKKIYKNTLNWVYKKAVTHPICVENYTKAVLKKLKDKPEITALSLSYGQIYKDLSIAAILHDIGRLSEIDIANGVVLMNLGKLRLHHASIGYNILEKTSIKTEIMLAIKHHRFADVSELLKDPEYLKLSENSKKIARFYTEIIQDTDKLANLDERAKHGATKSSEYYNPSYLKDYKISKDVMQQAMSGHYVGTAVKHLLDIMVHYITWGYETHFAESKEELAEVTPEIFKRIYEEIQREYENSAIKDENTLAETLSMVDELKKTVQNN